MATGGPLKQNRRMWSPWKHGYLQGIYRSDAQGTSGVAASQSSCQIQFNFRGEVCRPAHPQCMLSSQYTACHVYAGSVTVGGGGEHNSGSKGWPKWYSKRRWLWRANNLNPKVNGFLEDDRHFKGWHFPRFDLTTGGLCSSPVILGQHLSKKFPLWSHTCYVSSPSIVLHHQGENTGYLLC